MHVQSAKRSEQCPRILPRRRLEIMLARALIANPEAPAGIRVFHGMAILPQAAHQIGHALHGVSKWRHVGNLRSDVYAYASNAQESAFRSLLVQAARLLDRNSELMLMQSSGNVRMRLGGNIRIYAQRDAGNFPHAGRALRQSL